MAFLDGVGDAIGSAVGGFLGNSMAGATAKANAKAYNKYQEMTYGADTMRQQQRLDTLYPGTSPWERLGVNAATPMPSPMEGSTAAQNAQAFLPLQIARIQSETQKDVANIGAQATRDAAGLSSAATKYGADKANETAIAVTKLQTADGALPFANLNLAKAQEVFTKAQAVLSEKQSTKTDEETKFVRAQTDKVGDERRFLQAQTAESRGRTSLQEDQRANIQADTHLKHQATRLSKQQESNLQYDAQYARLKPTLEFVKTVAPLMTKETAQAGAYSQSWTKDWEELARAAANGDASLLNVLKRMDRRGDLNRVEAVAEWISKAQK